MGKTVRIALLCTVALLVVVFSSPFLSNQATGTSSYSESSFRSIAVQDGSLVINITPTESTLYQNESKMFHLIVLNPPTNDDRLSGFLYAGYKIQENSLNITVADRSPDVRYNGVMARYFEFNLSPGGKRVFPILVHRGSETGDHRLNVTAIYFEKWNLTRESSFSQLEVQPTRCLFPCQIKRAISGMLIWIENNWEWIVSVLSLIVAVLSLLAPNRVRKFVGLSELPASESTKE